MRFLHSLGIFSFSRLFSALAILSIGVMTARLLGPEVRGYYALFFTIVGLAGNATNFGLSQANTYLLNRERLPLGALAGNTFLFILIWSLITAAGLLLAFGMIDRSVIGSEGSLPWLLLWAAIIATLAELSFAGLVYGSHFYLLQSKSLIYQAILLLGATLLILPLGNDLETALTLRVIAVCLFTLWYVAAFWHQAGPMRADISMPMLAKQIQFGSRNWLQNLIGLLNYRGYFLVLAIYSGPEAVGIFSIALLFVEAVRFLPDTIATLLLPRLVGMDAGRNAGELAALTCRVVLSVVTLIACGLFLSTPLLVPFVFGAAYHEGVVIARILLIGSVFGVVYQVMTRYFTSEAKQIYSIYSAIIALITAAVTSLWLVPRFGTAGAAVAFTSSAVAAAVSMLIAFRHYSGIPVNHTFIMRKDDWLPRVNRARMFLNQILFLKDPR